MKYDLTRKITILTEANAGMGIAAFIPLASLEQRL
jgi:hypothetical protein